MYLYDTISMKIFTFYLMELIEWLIAVEKKSIINPELWQACAGPLVNMPVAGTHVVYFPQGHSEQVLFLIMIYYSRFI